ncbi:hypothetical protein D3C73_1333090 [compost metagenome]
MPDERRESEWEGIESSEEASVRPALTGRQIGGKLRKRPLSSKLLQFRCACRQRGHQAVFGTVRPQPAFGNGASATSTIASRRSRLTPSRACTEMPCSTVAK